MLEINVTSGFVCNLLAAELANLGGPASYDDAFGQFLAGMILSEAAPSRHHPARRLVLPYFMQNHSKIAFRQHWR